MQTRLPDQIDLWKLAATTARLQGEVALADMPRLTSLLSAFQDQVAVRLEGGTDKQQVPFVAGNLEVTVELICQRCLEPIQWPLSVAFRWGLVHAEGQAAGLPKEYDPLVVPESGVMISALVEDELILALPLIPRHNDIRQCEANGFALPPQAPSARRNPFAALSPLKDLKKEP